MRKLQDPDNAELKQVLEILLFEDVDITIREVARRHTELKNASAFSRNAIRMSEIAEARQRQIEARNIARKLASSNERNNVDENETQKVALLDLEKQVTRLVAAHAGLIRAVQLAGGMGALERFWLQYKEIGDAVHNLGAVSRNAMVLDFPQSELK